MPLESISSPVKLGHRRPPGAQNNVPSITCARRSPRTISSCASASLSVKKSESVMGSCRHGGGRFEGIGKTGGGSGPRLAGLEFSPSPWYPASRLVILVTDVTKLEGTVLVDGSTDGFGSSGNSSGDGVLSLEQPSVGSWSTSGDVGTSTSKGLEADPSPRVNTRREPPSEPPVPPVKFSQDGVLEQPSVPTVKSVIWSGVNIPRLSSCSNEFCFWLSIK